MQPPLTQTPAGWAEPAPSHCPNGHRLAAGTVIVTWDPDIRHRVWECRECGATTTSPRT